MAALRRWLWWLVALAAGCGAQGGGSAPPATLRSFDVMAQLTSPGTPPSSTRFTLIFDESNARILVGAGGRATAVAVRSRDGRTFVALGPFSLGVRERSCGEGPLRMELTGLVFTLSGDRLTGHATTQISLGATSDGIERSQDVDATLAGVADATAPGLLVPPGTDVIDPMSPFVFWATEPLPPTARARLITNDGGPFELVPVVADGPVPMISGFAKPDVVVGTGPGIHLALDGLTDFAGNAPQAGEQLRVPTSGDAPLVGPDGFESATGATLGGAAVIRSGPGVPIAGGVSLFIGRGNSPQPAELPLSPALTVRMAVPPGATKVRFSFRQLFLVAKVPGFVRLGSVGRPPGEPVALRAATVSSAVTVGGELVNESSIDTMEVPLPADVAGEVVVLIHSPPIDCPDETGTPGLVIDDLRLE